MGGRIRVRSVILLIDAKVKSTPQRALNDQMEVEFSPVCSLQGRWIVRECGVQTLTNTFHTAPYAKAQYYSCMQLEWES